MNRFCWSFDMTSEINLCLDINSWLLYLKTKISPNGIFSCFIYTVFQRVLNWAELTIDREVVLPDFCSKIRSRKSFTVFSSTAIDWKVSFTVSSRNICRIADDLSCNLISNIFEIFHICLIFYSDPIEPPPNRRLVGIAISLSSVLNLSETTRTRRQTTRGWRRRRLCCSFAFTVKWFCSKSTQLCHLIFCSRWTNSFETV